MIYPKYRKEVVRKLPSYDVLKHDYLELGLSVEQIAQKYDVGKASAYRVLKYRAEKRGEWPLASKRYKINPVAIIEMVFDFVQEQDMTISDFARRCGVYDTTLYELRSGKIKTLKPEIAYRLLTAIGEPAPDWVIGLANLRQAS